MTNKHNFIIIIILTLSVLSPWADNVVYAQPQDAGKIVSYRKVTGGVSGRTERGIFDIRAYGDNAIRVRISRKQALRDFSYMLDDGVAPTDATIKDSAGIILVKTPNILLRIEKTPSIRLTFMDNLGNILNEDEPGTGFGTTFEGNRVTSYKKLHEKERFVGLGEALGNWTGEVPSSRCRTQTLSTMATQGCPSTRTFRSTSAFLTISAMEYSTIIPSRAQSISEPET